MRSLPRKIRALLALPDPERRFFLSAWLATLHVTLRLLTGSPRRFLAGESVPRSPSARSDREEDLAGAPEEAREFIRRAAELVELAGRHAPVRDTCLKRALVLRRLLARRGIETVLHLGVARSPDDFAAHAWLEWRGSPITPEERGEEYTPLFPGE